MSAPPGSRRLAADGPFESTLPPTDERSVRSVGFTPARQVLGTTVFRLSTKGMWSCGATPFAIGQKLAVLEVPTMQEAQAHCRRLAIDRLAQECATLGADGAVDVSLEVGTLGEVGHEYLARGTAIRSTGRVRAPRPFVAGMSGAEFGATLRAGWVPCGMAVGVGVSIRHDDIRTQLRGMSRRNQEVAAWTELITTARARARQMLLEDCARLGGEGVVIAENSLSVAEHGCARSARNWLGESDVKDHLATATILGTVVVPFSANTPGPVPEFVINLSRM